MKIQKLLKLSTSLFIPKSSSNFYRKLFSSSSKTFFFISSINFLFCCNKVQMEDKNKCKWQKIYSQLRKSTWCHKFRSQITSSNAQGMNLECMQRYMNVYAKQNHLFRFIVKLENERKVRCGVSRDSRYNFACTAGILR